MLLSIENRDDWETYRRAGQRREAFRPEADKSLIKASTDAIYVRTNRDAQLEQAIAATLLRNGGTKRHWLAVDGPADLGKTEMLLHFAMGFHNTEQGQSPPRPGFASVPIILVQADSGQQGAGLLRAIASFAGIPAKADEDTLRRRLTQVLPSLGTRLIVVDDAHMLRRSSPRATKLTDSLRANLRLPVTFIYVGIDLASSALLKSSGGPGYESTDQLRHRHSFLRLEPLTLPRDAQVYKYLLGEFLRAVKSLVPHLAMPFHRDGRGLNEVMQITNGHTGTFMGALKDAVGAAIWADEPVTSALLLKCATHRLDVAT